MYARWHLVSILILILMTTLVIVPAAMADDESNGLGVRLNIGRIGISNMPLSIRNLPNHPDDSAFSAGPIEKTSYSIPGDLSVNYRVGTIKAQDSRLDINLCALFYPSFGEPVDMAERNYTNNPGSSDRGYGAALTFVGLREQGLVYIFSPELIWTRKLREEERLSVSLGFFRIQAVTGWDRYDELQQQSTNTLANCFPLGVEYSPNGKLMLGLQYVLMSKTALGAEIRAPLRATLRYEFSGF